MNSVGLERAALGIRERRDVADHKAARAQLVLPAREVRVAAVGRTQRFDAGIGPLAAHVHARDGFVGSSLRADERDARRPGRLAQPGEEVVDPLVDRQAHDPLGGEGDGLDDPRVPDPHRPGRCRPPQS